MRFPMTVLRAVTLTPALLVSFVLTVVVCALLPPALGLVLLLLCLHVAPAARDEALLRDRLGACVRAWAGCGVVGAEGACMHATLTDPRTRTHMHASIHAAEALVVVNQSRAIQQLASKLCAEL